MDYYLVGKPFYLSFYVFVDSLLFPRIEVAESKMMDWSRLPAILLCFPFLVFTRFSSTISVNSLICVFTSSSFFKSPALLSSKAENEVVTCFCAPVFDGRSSVVMVMTAIVVSGRG